MIPRRLLLVLFVVRLCSMSVPAFGHEAYPARFQLTEIEPGEYEATFSLPVIEGRKLRAEPVLPPTCQDTSPRKAGLTAAGYTSTWRVRCDPPSLAGEAIFINGLLGTQTDLMLQIATLDGRQHTVVLKPSRPGVLVPEPPSLVGLAGRATVAGMRATLSQPALWLLMLVVGAMGSGRRAVITAAAAFGLGHAGAQWAADQRWLLLSAQVGPLFALCAVLLPALDCACGRERAGRVSELLQPLWPAALLLGVLYGGTGRETLPPEGLSRGEQSLAAVLFAVGLAAGLMVAAATMAELRQLLGTRWSVSTVGRIAGYLAGTLAVSLVVLRASAMMVGPFGAPGAAVELALLTAVLGAGLTSAPVRRPAPVMMVWVGLIAAGLALGLAGVSLPGGTLACHGGLFFLGAWLALGGSRGGGWWLALSLLAVTAASWNDGLAMATTASLPIASGVGSCVVAVAVLGIANRLAKRVGGDQVPPAVRLLGAGSAAAAILVRLAEYSAWFDERVATDAALGLIRVPVLAIALAILAVAIRPRRRTALARLGVETRRSSAHWLLLAVAFFVVPLGTIAARNPFYEASAPEGDEARRVIASVLTNTYQAFNLPDEDELYQRLSENVSGGLVEDLYLDSRRRLRAGTRAGAEVTVRDVSVLELGEAVGGSNPTQGFSYDCRWVVTARVRHLQHVHHRQNIYSGVLTIRVDGDRWKISGVDLRSEDRVVLSWRQT